MKTTTLLDNWTLQDAFEFLDGELTADVYPSLKYRADAELFEWEPVSRDLARFEAFCQLLRHLVFTDEVWVDKDNMSAWDSSPSAQVLRGTGLIIGRNFSSTKDQWVVIRKAIENQLCWNDALKKQFEANKRAFISGSGEVDQRLSTLIWGGAGMLARAAFTSTMYESHSLRADLFRKSGFLPGPERPLSHLDIFLKEKRLHVFKKIDARGFLANLSLPPIVALVASKAASQDEIIPVALEYRKEFGELRAWLGRWQEALASESLDALMVYQNTLDEVAAYFESISSTRDVGDTTVQVGVSWLKLSTKIGSPMAELKNRIGVRAEINRLLLAPLGHESTRKLVSLVAGDNNSPAANLTLDIFSGKRVSA